ncbi:hypothetical protein [Streptomyces vinaceus]|uniref:hypothetical protein n=1 Tax=Streptomyces vinaceus TaxID=1960 RepID=UPI003688EDAE
MGALSLAVCFLFLAWTITVYTLGKALPGWTSLVITVLFFGAVQLFCLGLLGEYLARIYTAVQARPTYAVAHDTAEGQQLSGLAGQGHLPGAGSTGRASAGL